MLASISSEGIGLTLAVEGATTAAVFEAYVERVLAPSLEVGQIVVMDNLGAHRPKRVREPIEEAFAKLKHLLRKASVSTKEALVVAIAPPLSRSVPMTSGASSSKPDTGLRLACRETRRQLA